MKALNCLVERLTNVAAVSLVFELWVQWPQPKTYLDYLAGESQP